MKKVSELRVGDRVLRHMHVADISIEPMPLFVIHVTDEFICCSLTADVDYFDSNSQMPVWEFSRLTGQEHDPDLLSIMGLAGQSYSVSHVEPA